ncbi:MAG: sigma-70 family RNA polymerase sigma factor [Phycisphaerales bacterium]
MDLVETTTLVQRGRAGDAAAQTQLFGHVYQELRRIAEAYMRRERAGHTLDPTALVHEAFVRLVDQTAVRWEDRTYFYGVAATTMRRILVGHARARGRVKRGGDRRRVALDPAELAGDPTKIDLVELDDALDRLAHIDDRKARVVELRYFGGLGTKETADLLGVSEPTVKRDWAFARAWLLRELCGGDVPA